MRTTMNRDFPRKLLKDPDTRRRVLMPEARRVQGKLEMRTRRRTGRTALSTHIEDNHMNAKRDRVAVRVVQSGGAVPMNWRTVRGYMIEAVR